MVNLIYDSSITGHHTEYISHLVDFLVDNPTEENYVFVVNSEIQNKFPEIVLKSAKSPHVSWDFIDDKVVNELEKMSKIKRSFKEYHVMEKFSMKYNASHVILMYFNIFQVALIFNKPSYSVSGILFLQFYRMKVNNWKERLKFWRKYLTTKLFTINKQISRVFILNDYKTVEYLNERFQTSIFDMLADPIPNYKEEIGFDIYDYYNISKDKKILLHPGAIDPRKGTYEIIESIDYCDKILADHLVILIVGKAKEEIDKQIRNKIEIVKNRSFEIIFDNAFVANDRLKSLFIQSHAVLIPYKNVEASSGILGHAFAANKPVVVPNTGLIGEIVKDNEGGILIDKVDGVSIAKSYEKLYENNFYVKNNVNFVLLHSVENFSRKILY